MTTVATPPVAADHPRSRGVYCGCRYLRVVTPRIIPARAGFTWECACPVTGRPDHPRSRGVYDVSDMRGKIMWGSSPLARGLQIHEIEERIKKRIIPARAGFT